MVSPMVSPSSLWQRLHHIIGGGIVVAWVTTIIVQQSSCLEQPVDFSQTLAPPLKGVTQTFGIYYGDTKVGFARSQRVAREEGGARFFDRAYWQFRAQGSVQRLAIESEAEIGPQWQLERFHARVDAGVARIQASGEVKNGVLHLKMVTGGRVRQEQIPVNGPMLVPGVLRAFVAASDPEPGAVLEMDVFNPLLRSVQKVVVVVQQRTDEGWQIVEALHRSIETTAWIDHEGNTLREESALGFQMVAEEEAKALAMPEDSDHIPDLVFAAAAPLSGELPEQVTAIKRLRLQLSGVNPQDFSALAGDRQRLLQHGVEINVVQPPQAAPYQLPFALEQVTVEETLGQQLLAAMRPEALVQADDPRIIAQAKRVVGSVKDPVRAATLLAQWVNRTVKKQSSVGVPNASEVFDTMTGDCNEHTVFYTALARAVGIPTRMASGLVYADLPGSKSMYYHAWPEVWLGQWLALDPTFGQIPADATHIRFVVGGLERQVEILKLIGSVRVAVEAVTLSDDNTAAAAGQEVRVGD